MDSQGGLPGTKECGGPQRPPPQFQHVFPSVAQPLRALRRARIVAAPHARSTSVAGSGTTGKIGVIGGVPGGTGGWELPMLLLYNGGRFPKPSSG